jgi:hypothetical protein
LYSRSCCWSSGLDERAFRQIEGVVAKASVANVGHVGGAVDPVAVGLELRAALPSKYRDVSPWLFTAGWRLAGNVVGVITTTVVRKALHVVTSANSV